jgi:hypothetical protein
MVMISYAAFIFFYYSLYPSDRKWVSHDFP